MDQKITIRIADRKYALTASSPENEELIRSAAAVINAKLYRGPPGKERR